MKVKQGNYVVELLDNQNRQIGKNRTLAGENSHEKNS